MIIQTFLIKILVDRDNFSSSSFVLEDSVTGTPLDIYRLFDLILGYCEIETIIDFPIGFTIFKFDVKPFDDRSAIYLEGTKQEFLELKALIESNKKAFVGTNYKD